MKGDWKGKVAYGALMLCAFWKVTVVPNTQGSPLYQPMKAGVITMGWVLAVYLFHWYTRKKQWEKASPEERRELERAETDERNQFLWGQAGVVMSVLDCVPGMLMVVVLFGVQMLSYLGRLRVLNQRF